MGEPVVMSCSRTYPVTVEEAFDAVLPLPLNGCSTVVRTDPVDQGDRGPG